MLDSVKVEARKTVQLKMDRNEKSELEHFFELEKHSLEKMWKTILENSSIHGIKYLDR